MAIKSHVVIEITKDDHVFSFHMPVGAPLGKAYDACHDALLEILEFSKQAAAAAKQTEAAATN